MTYIMGFSQLNKSNIASAGGKGANLGELTTAGLPVPPGFVLTTKAYDAFVQGHGLQTRIVELAGRVGGDDPLLARRVAGEIRDLFLEADMPADIGAAVIAAYVALGATAVAVRSSATAEDLPTASFAGQQDTFLNIRDEAALLVAVKNCWASLWTARAMTYRQRQGIAADSVSLAVVVQTLVAAEAAGILFTANPTNGERDQILINATWGLGEAIVGGLVTPDTVVVNKVNWSILARETATKKMMTVRTEAGTAEQAVPLAQQERAVLGDETAVALARYGADIEAHYGQPMDIEWALADSEIAILQARPITALPAEPLKNVVWEPPMAKTIWMRRQIVEHMPEPLSPLFEDLYVQRGLDKSIKQLIDQMGDLANVRFNLDTMMPQGFADTINGYAYTTGTVKMDAQALHALIVVYPRVFKMLNMPVFDWENSVLPTYQAVIARWDGLDLATADEATLLAGISEMAMADSVYWWGSALSLGMSRFLDPLFDILLKSVLFRGALPQAGLGSSAFLRGFDSKALDAQADMEQIADDIRASMALTALVLKTPAARLLPALATQLGGQPVLASIDRYLAQYGHQIYNLDFAVPTQREDPLPMFLSLKALVNKASRTAVRVRQAKMAAERDGLIAQTMAALNPVSRKLFAWVWCWTKHYAPYREHVMFYLGAAWPTVRKLAAELGQRLTAAGTIATPDDVYFLSSSEIRRAIDARATGAEVPDFRQLAQKRRGLRESRKLLTPMPKVPARSTIKVGPIKLSLFDPTPTDSAANSGPVLTGYAVSTGQVTGPATVIHSLEDFDKMQPDSILVCTTTTPAWTPLFSQAAGLVTDVGGALAHGSIVAREYGIPAVMGTGVATERIQTGMMLAVDGDKGTVTLLAEVDETAVGVRGGAGGTAVGHRKKAGIALVIVALVGLIWWKKRKNNS